MNQCNECQPTEACVRRLHPLTPVKSMQSPVEPANNSAAAPATLNPERWVDEYGDYLFKFAMTRLRDTNKSQDAVQETFLSALKCSQSFKGRGAERTWLVGILKHKIIDHFRKASHETSFTDLQFYCGDEEDHFLDDILHNGVWTHDAAPQEWPNQAQSLDNALFWQAYHDCVNRLPEKLAVAFHLREVDGVESKEICALLNISEANLWVMLHRARMALRRSLETDWFAKEFLCIA